MRLLLFRLTVILLITICNINVYSQSQINDLPVVSLPSPTAAALGKYGDIPVGKYTGISNVEIPVYNLSLGKFNLPITLNYHSAGLKVEEMAGWAGLNWSLSAGGVITRTVHNKADEGPQGYWNYANYSDAELLTITSVDIVTNPFWFGNYDTEPDMFYFNFSGISGKFVLDGSAAHVAHCIPYNNLKIEHNSSLTSFTITNTNGDKYIFDVREITTAGTTDYTSSWYLSKIITQAGTVNLSYYNNLEYSSIDNLTEADYTTLIASTSKPKAAENLHSAPEIVSKVLQQIDAPGETIRFFVSRNRRDIINGSALDSLTVQDYNSAVKKDLVLSIVILEM